jgi:5-hydroxyisourate hydrolase-like protein (transthyretin family)
MNMLKTAAALTLALLLSVPALADNIITGTVKNATTDAPIEGASVSLLALDNGPVQTVKTDKDGQYQFTLAQPGTFNLKVEASQYMPFTRTELRVRQGKTTRYNVPLLPVDAPQ